MRWILLLSCALCNLLPAIVQAGLEETIDFSGTEGSGFGTSKKHTRYWKCGTGFFVSKDGYFVTDALTVKDANDIVVVWHDKAFDARIVSLSASNRVAALKVNGAKFPPVTMAQTDSLVRGGKVNAVGCSVSAEDGVGLSTSDCVVSVKTRRIIKVFGTFAASMTGCPVIDNAGKTAGMILSSGGERQSECSVVSALSILSLLPASVRKKLIYNAKAFGKGENAILQTSDSIALVLVYNDERLNAERVASTTHTQESQQNQWELTADKLGELTESAKAGKTHLHCTGSGFFVSTDGYILTNHHVVDEAMEIMIVHNGKPYKASLRAQSKEKDLALLKVDGLFNPVVIATDGECVVGQTIFTVGYPQVWLQGLEAKATKGIISSRSGFRGEKSDYQIDAAIQSGNSGGPVADETGRVVGVCVATLRDGQNVNYAIKWPIVESFLPKGVALHKRMWNKGGCFADSVAKVIDSCVIVLNFKKGGAALDYSSLAPDRRLEAESMIRKRILYAKLAKIRKNWKEVKELTDDVLAIDPSAKEAKELNDLACDELGLHLVVVAVVDGRDVPAKIDPICGFRDKWLLCGHPLALLPGQVKGHVTWKQDGKTWQGDLDCIHNWHGIKEITVNLSKME